MVQPQPAALLAGAGSVQGPPRPPSSIQPKLTGRASNDFYEREADRAARQVVGGLSRITHPVSLAPPLGGVISRVSALAPPAPGNLSLGSAEPFPVTRHLEQRLQDRQGHGTPVPADTRSVLEAGLGADFSQVRLHTDPEAAQLSQSIHAEAFTHGADIYFNRGRYQPTVPSGRELLAHELTHTIQQGASGRQESRSGSQTNAVPATIQRKPLSPDEILKSLDSIPFVRDKLDQLPHRTGVGRKVKLEAMRTEVKAILDQYQNNLLEGADSTEASALTIAVVLQAVSRIIALNDLNDPALAPLLTIRLLELYEPEIKKKLKGLDRRDEALKLAAGLAVDDPVGLYMHQELRLDEAARRIRTMAVLGGKEPQRMFELLRQRFEIEVATLQRAKVAQQEDRGADGGGKFTVREATGEISEAYFDRLFGHSVNQPSWKTVTMGRGRWELAFGSEADRRLGELEAAVGVQGSDARGYTGNIRSWQRTGDATVHEFTPKQSAHFAEVEQKDAAIDRVHLDARMIVRLATIFQIDADAAAELLSQVKAGLFGLPLTLTVKGASWFSAGDPKSTLYAPGSARKQEISLATLFDRRRARGTVKHLGEFDDTTGQGRGVNYGRFRNWKDQTMSGNRGFSDRELPSFGAVNINWTAHSSKDLDTNYGENSYGDTHFILRKANVLPRLVYTATDHGRPTRDIYLAFCDFVLGDDATQSQTGLKKTENLHVIYQVINSIFTQKPVITGVQCFEVQIFGEVDIAKDVEKIAVAPSVAPEVQLKIAQFCGPRGIAFEVVSKPAEALVNGQWFTPPLDRKGDSLVSQLQTILAGALLPTGY